MESGGKWVDIELTPAEVKLLLNKEAQMHHISTILGTEWGKSLGRLFKQAGLDPRGAANLMVLIGHSGRHTNEYHAWVFRRLSAAFGSKTGETARLAMLDKLAWIREQLRLNPRLPYAKEGFPK